jgi:hypothetical protein
MALISKLCGTPAVMGLLPLANITHTKRVSAATRDRQHAEH